MSSHFDLVDFRLFANIAEAKSLTAGAQRSNLSTSAASLRIRHLEESLGGKLFHRTSHGSTLTPAGEACLHHIRAILDQFESLKGDIQRYSEERDPGLRVAVNSSGVHEPFPTVMRTYRQRFPDTKLSLDIMMSAEISQAVADGVAHIGIGGSKAAKVKILPYLTDELALILSSDHPLAGAQSVRFAEALDYDIISFPETSNTQIFMRRIAQNSRKPMRSSVTVNSFEGLFQMLQTGLGVGVLSSRVARLHIGEGLRMVPLKDKSAQSNIDICVPDGRKLPDHVLHFVELLQQASEGEKDEAAA